MLNNNTEGILTKTKGNIFSRRGIEKYATVGVLIVLIIFASLLSDVFLTSKNLLNILRQVSANGIISIGLLMVILTGGIDISVGSVVGVTSVMFAVLYDPKSSVAPFNALVKLLSALMPGNRYFGLIAAIIILLLIGALLGYINGIVICKANIQPFIMTIGTLTFYRGIALLIPNGRPVYMKPETAEKVKFLGEGRIAGIPTPVIILLLLGLIIAFLLNRTTFGRYIRAIGGNQEAARVAGINVNRYKIMTYVLCGVMAAIAGILVTSRTTTGEPTLGTSYEMDAIAACVIGGAKLTGGIGTVGGTILGAIIIGVLNNMLNLINVSAYYQYLVRGAIIVLAVVFRTVKKSK